MNYLISTDDFLAIFNRYMAKCWLKPLSHDEFKNSLKHFRPFYHTLEFQKGLEHLFSSFFFFPLTEHRKIEARFITPRKGDSFLIICTRGAFLKKEYGERKFIELCETGKIKLFSFACLEVLEKI